MNTHNQFLMQLDPDPQTAEQNYVLLRSKLIAYFQRNRCRDPHNLADDVIVRVLRRLSEGTELRTGIQAYCYGVAEYVLREEKRRHQYEELQEETPCREPVRFRRLSGPEQAVLIKQFLCQLTAEDQHLFWRYHLDDRTDLARETRLTANGLRVRVWRIRQRLLGSLVGASGAVGSTEAAAQAREAQRQTRKRRNSNVVPIRSRQIRNVRMPAPTAA